MTNQEASKIIKDGLEDMSLDFADDEQYEALTMAIKALQDMEWLSKKRPCDFCKHHKTIYEQDGYYSECTRWECQFEAGKGEEEDRR